MELTAVTFLIAKADKTEFIAEVHDNVNAAIFSTAAYDVPVID